jgi:hypothetical protein
MAKHYESLEKMIINFFVRTMIVIALFLYLIFFT